MNPRKAKRGSDALVCGLTAAGVRRIFTLSGNHIMPVFDAAFASGIELIHTRHEAAAVHMADAYARITGEVGVALVTGGPGHANAVSALYTAQMAESPVVLLSGHAPNNQLGMGAFQEMRQADMAAPVHQAFLDCEGADNLASDMTNAIASRVVWTARPGTRQPANRCAEAAACRAARRRRPSPPCLSRCADRHAQQIMQRLAQAQRPLVLVGPGHADPAGRRPRWNCSCSGVPVIGMESPRGVADPQPGRVRAGAGEGRLSCCCWQAPGLHAQVRPRRPSRGAAEVHSGRSRRRPRSRRGRHGASGQADRHCRRSRAAVRRWP